MSNPVSPKVSAAAVASAGATLVVTTLAAHLFHGQVPADVLRLAEAAFASVGTFAAGWFARVVPASVVSEVETVASSLVADVVDAPVPAASPIPGGAV